MHIKVSRKLLTSFNSARSYSGKDKMKIALTVIVLASAFFLAEATVST